ncbi:MAG TPA: DUF3489 domain-containing protein [Bradyrhizobium sp.]|nr:DUF3489 domain-containing protein [Bradyrhizobium sp.]
MVKTNRSLKSKPAAKPRSKATSTRKPGPTKATGETKRDQVLALLRQSGGASIDTIVKATGWQEHSVRGFLAGTVRKKLGLNLESEKRDGQRIYRVTATKPSGGKSGTAAPSEPKVA